MLASPTIAQCVIAMEGQHVIPRVCMRTLDGRPLVYHAVKTALQVQSVLEKPSCVYVVSNDEEVLGVSEKYGATPLHVEAEELSQLLEQVALQLPHTIKTVLVTFATSPLISVASCQHIWQKLHETPDLHLVASALPVAKADWQKTHYNTLNQWVPVETSHQPIAQRLVHNVIAIRQSALLQQKITHLNQLQPAALVQLPTEETIHIKSVEDFNLCHFYLTRKTIAFALTGNATVGLGHVYRAMVLANHLTCYHMVFLLDSDSQLGVEKLSNQGFDARLQERKSLTEDLLALQPDVVINDRLDTTPEMMQPLVDAGMAIINFEDLGEGARLANVVINDLYPEAEPLPNHYFGPAYFCAREEFLATPVKHIMPSVKHVLLTFGGTDPCNLTRKVLQAIYTDCVARGITIHIVAGLGYTAYETLLPFPNIEIHRDIKTISTFMYQADVMFTSAGRTVYEAACIGTPTIVLAQNQREMTHFWANKTNGFYHLGLGSIVEETTIHKAFIELVENEELRQQMHQRMLAGKLREGMNRVIELIEGVIDGTQARSLRSKLSSRSARFNVLASKAD